MEGLEISEVYLSDIYKNKDKRLDSSFYIYYPLKNKSLSYKKIGSILLLSQYGLSISMSEEQYGYPIYRMNEIHSMLCDLGTNKYIDIPYMEVKSYILNNQDVLFNRTNSFEWVGRTGIYYQHDDVKRTFASYLVRFVPDKKVVTPEYLTCFLNSKQGVQDLKRRARESINQTNINPEEVKEIEIPILSLIVQNFITNNYISAHEKRIKAYQLYQQAEEILLEELGLTNFIPTQQAISIKSIKESFEATGRLDAEYYQPKYEEIIFKIKTYSDGFFHLKDFIKNFSTGYPYQSNTYLENNGIPLIRINNIYKGYLDISNCAYIPEKDFLLSSKDIAQEDDILISMSGTIGNVCTIPKGITAVINQRIMRITLQNYNNHVIALFINSVAGFVQLERIGTGGVQTNISANDIQSILIPNLSIEKQQKISTLIQQSFALKSQSEKLLDIAKQAVEMAIEFDEETVMQFIKENTNNIDLIN